MFSTIRKAFSNAAARIAAVFTGGAAAQATADQAETGAAPTQQLAYNLPPAVAPKMEFVGRSRSRTAHSNRDARRKHGIPHGTSGAKLVRRAMERRLTLRGQDVARYAA
jgi:hypothetical protein